MTEYNYEHEVNVNNNVYIVESTHSVKKTSVEVICELLSSRFRRN